MAPCATKYSVSHPVLLGPRRSSAGDTIPPAYTNGPTQVAPLEQRHIAGGEL